MTATHSASIVSLSSFLIKEWCWFLNTLSVLLVQWTAEMNAAITQKFFAWLVGSLEVKEVDVQFDGKQQTWKSGVQIIKCRYLEQSGCKGMCINMCKVSNSKSKAKLCLNVVFVCFCLPFTATDAHMLCKMCTICYHCSSRDPQQLLSVYDWNRCLYMIKLAVCIWLNLLSAQHDILIIIAL